MSKSDEQKMAALVRKNVAKAAKTKVKTRRRYDQTLPPESEPEDLERRAFFQEMKKREF